MIPVTGLVFCDEFEEFELIGLLGTPFVSTRAYRSAGELSTACHVEKRPISIIFWVGWYGRLHLRSAFRVVFHFEIF
jgi:hypothetical protein